MGKLSYSEQLAHPNWQRRRLEILDAAGWTCQRCRATESTLHVHHRHYIKGRMAWEYADEELEALCKHCHQDEHEAEALEARVQAWLDAAIGPGTARSLLLGYAEAVGFTGPGEGKDRSQNRLAYEFGQLLPLLHELFRRHGLAGMAALMSVLSRVLRRDSPEALDQWHKNRGSTPSTVPAMPQDVAALEAFSALIDRLRERNAARAAAGEAE